MRPCVSDGVGQDAVAVPEEKRKPWWLYPNLLGLDAPLVAMAWLYIFQRTWSIRVLPWEAYVALALVVWAVYAFDRLLDVSLEGHLRSRHQYHARHQKVFRVGIVSALCIAGGLLLFYLQTFIFLPYLLLGAVLVAGYYGLSMLASQDSGELPYLKNIVAGFTFAYGTALTAYAYRFTYDIGDLLQARELYLFGGLCAINIVAIDVWERGYRSKDVEEESARELGLGVSLALLGLYSLVLALRDDLPTVRAFCYAVLTGAGLHYVLDRKRESLTLDQARVLADLSLLVPLLVFVAVLGG